jgi:hypothetical protein
MHKNLGDGYSYLPVPAMTVDGITVVGVIGAAAIGDADSTSIHPITATVCVDRVAQHRTDTRTPQKSCPPPAVPETTVHTGSTVQQVLPGLDQSNTETDTEYYHSTLSHSLSALQVTKQM